MATIEFLPAHATVEAPPGTPLVAAARTAGLDLELPCGGDGSCGRCIVRTTGGEVRTESRGRVPASAVASGYVLACQTRVHDGAITVELPDRSRADGQFADDEEARLLVDTTLLPRADDLEPLVEKWSSRGGAAASRGRPLRRRPADGLDSCRAKRRQRRLHIVGRASRGRGAARGRRAGDGHRPARRRRGAGPRHRARRHHLASLRRRRRHRHDLGRGAARLPADRRRPRHRERRQRPDPVRRGRDQPHQLRGSARRASASCSGGSWTP